MKKVLFSTLAFAVIIPIALVLTGCFGGTTTQSPTPPTTPDNQNHAIIGTWKNDDAPFKDVYVFSQNGAFTRSFYVNNNRQFQDVGTWSIQSENSVRLNFTQPQPHSFTFQFTISGNILLTLEGSGINGQLVLTRA
ncbi:MAG: hypothetical protein FWE16_05740 [Firmicutes bacterium]|nr:hypothetical protein [Bacillota bacterium]